MSTIWSFTPLDTSFFREAKPFNAGEGGFLDSMFPPSAQTLIGAFRSAVGEAEGVDWKAYQRDAGHPLRKVIGTPESIDPLSFEGPYLLKDGQRLYPVPLYLLTKYNKPKQKLENKEELLKWMKCSDTNGGGRQWARLEPGNVVTTDMGEVRLPEKSGSLEGGKSPEELWLDTAQLARVLKGELPEEAVLQDELVASESRTGIARDNDKRTVRDGMLYFTRHLRLNEKEDVAFGMVIEGITEDINPTVTRLGGEGRLAKLDRVQGYKPIEPPVPKGGEQGLIVTLVTHADFIGEPEPDWSALGVTRISACIGKAVREGGWDYAKHEPKPLASLVPAGSSYFVTVDGELGDTIQRLHGSKIGNRKEQGYGEIVVGLWK